MRLLSIVVLGCLAVSVLHSQQDRALRLSPGDLPGLEVSQTGRFEGNALFGYMDGGAELYREFGFVDLTVQEIRIGNHELLVELFRMRDSLAAFGVFSVFRGDCSGEDTSAMYWCSSPGQVLSARGHYFLRVQRLTGEAEGEGLTRSVASRLLSLIPDPGAILLPWCTTSSQAGGWQRKAILIRGPLGLQNAFPDWIDPLEPGGYSTITIVPWMLAGTPATLGWIQCVSEEAASTLEQFIGTFARPGGRYIKRCAKDAFLVVEADLPTVTLAACAEQILNSH